MGIYGCSLNKHFPLTPCATLSAPCEPYGYLWVFQKPFHHQPPPCHFDRREKTSPSGLPLPFMRRSFLSRASFEMTAVRYGYLWVFLKQTFSSYAMRHALCALRTIWVFMGVPKTISPPTPTMSFRPQGENFSERTPAAFHAQKFSLSCLVRNDMS